MCVLTEQLLLLVPRRTMTDVLQVPVKYAPVFGVVAAVWCKVLRMLFKARFLQADHLSIFAVHAGGGAMGMLLTAFFARYVGTNTARVASKPNKPFHSNETTGLDGYSRLVDRSMGARFR